MNLLRAISGFCQRTFLVYKDNKMTYIQAIPIIYRKVKQQGGKINILELTRRMTILGENHNNITEKVIDIIVNRIVGK